MAGPGPPGGAAKPGERPPPPPGGNGRQAAASGHAGGWRSGSPQVAGRSRASPRPPPFSSFVPTAHIRRMRDPLMAIAPVACSRAARPSDNVEGIATEYARCRAASMSRRGQARHRTDGARRSTGARDASRREGGWMTRDGRSIDAPRPRVTVVMPTHERAAFLPRALDALSAQTFTAWELRAIDDGSTDGTWTILETAACADARIHVRRLPENRGLGAALNLGIEAAEAELIAYLPDDDTWYPDHLERLVAALDADPDAVLAHAGMRHHYNRESLEPLDADGLQLVQLLHRRIDGFRWKERDELVTDSLAWMGLDDLAPHGRFISAAVAVTCEWVDHPGQRHKLLREPVGGIAPYRRRYGVKHPLRFHSTAGDLIDEAARYDRYRDPARPAPVARHDGLRILLVGELAYNADRILALEEAGHRLFGLWMRDPYWYNTVGPLPFGHVVDATTDDPLQAIRETRPDVIYALLNWQAVPFAAHVLRENPGVPFVWHYKEGPFISLEKGHWPDLVELTAGADGVIHTSEEMRAWFGTVVPGADDPDRTLVLDGDLPKADWFAVPLPPRGPFDDGIHTVVPGRPIGLHPEDVAALAAENVHLHFYGDFTQGQWRGWIDRTRGLAPHHLHLHAAVGQERWVEEFGRYDAGWLHVFESRNGGELRRAGWDDLNIPARIATLAAGGLPMLQRANEGHVVATQTWARRTGAGILFNDWPDLAARLHDEAGMRKTRDSVRAVRPELTFDRHVPRLEAFLRATIGRAGARRAATLVPRPPTADDPEPRLRRAG